MESEKDVKREKAISLLQEKAKELSRNPIRDDFDSETVCFIKQKLGPWPRALEAAGLKERNGISSAEKNRIRRAEKKKERKLAAKSGENN